MELTVELVGDRNAVRNLEQMPDVVKVILRDKVGYWADELRDGVISNIQERLGEKSGALLDSVEVIMIDSGDRIDARIVISAPHALAQERGAVIPPHIIRPKNGKVLAFMGATGQKVFATQVLHPGATIRATHFARDAYRDIGPKISRGIKTAIVEGIRRNMRGQS